MKRIIVENNRRSESFKISIENLDSFNSLQVPDRYSQVHISKLSGSLGLSALKHSSSNSQNITTIESGECLPPFKNLCLRYTLPFITSVSTLFSQKRKVHIGPCAMQHFLCSTTGHKIGLRTRRFYRCHCCRGGGFPSPPTTCFLERDPSRINFITKMV